MVASVLAVAACVLSAKSGNFTIVSSISSSDARHKRFQFLSNPSLTPSSAPNLTMCPIPTVGYPLQALILSSLHHAADQQYPYGAVATDLCLQADSGCHPVQQGTMLGSSVSDLTVCTTPTAGPPPQASILSYFCNHAADKQYPHGAVAKDLCLQADAGCHPSAKWFSQPELFVVG